jgi:Cu/Ag efflux pump CusA
MIRRLVDDALNNRFLVLAVALLLHLPTLYMWMAGTADVLPAAEPEFDESE